MSFSVEIKGDKELIAELNRVMHEMDNSVEQLVNATGLTLASSIKRRYHAHESRGKVYTHHIVAQLPNGHLVKGAKRSKPHTASAPNNPPNSDSGRLANSVTFRRKNLKNSVAVEVISKVKYGAMLEWGTHKIIQRPLWRPEAKKALKEYNRRLKAILWKATR